MQCILYELLSQTGGVFWVKGELDVLDGLFAENEGVDRGGVFLANADCVVTIEGGTFTGGNTAGEGGVAYADVDATLYVNGGSFTGNNAGSSGGAFFIDIDVDFAVRVTLGWAGGEGWGREVRLGMLHTAICRHSFHAHSLGTYSW